MLGVTMEMPPAGKRGSKVLVVSYFAVVFLLSLVLPPLPVEVVFLPLPFEFVGALLLPLAVMVFLPVCFTVVDDCVFFPLFFDVVAACDEDCF